MEDNSSNSPRENDCGGDGEEEEEDRERLVIKDEKDSSSSSSSRFCIEETPVLNPPSTSRELRNMMEQKRRQKLNACITQLSQLVPFISNSPKKMEKTAVLRLSAAYLRLSQILLGLGEQQQELPLPLRNINLARIFLSERDMYLMITSTGKIVYVSEAVESLLGHTQNDLFGHSLYNIICPIDRDELKKNLKCDEELDESGSSTITNDDPSLSAKLGGQNSGIKIQRRSFYLRLVKKAVSRGEQPGLELVYVSGCLLILPNSGTKPSLLGENSVLLHAVVRPFNERRVTEVSLLEATKEEYITRHLLDGRIIYVDHRISIVSGFMPQEVSGTLAFTYMHKDDVRWVMIALRQMYFKGQSFGSSCYRLLSKNGQFVYMKTYGFLELNPDEDQVASFICVNVLVSPEEGKREILKMRERFTPLIRSRSEPGITAITNNQIMEADTTTSLEGSTTEDLSTINKVVEQMTKNIPAPAIDNVKETSQNPGPLPDSQFFKVKLFSKSMPPVLTSNAPKIEKKSSMSPQPNNNNINVPIKSVTEVVKPVIAEVKPFTQAKPTTQVKPIVQDRPSVLRVAPPVARQPVVVYALQTDKYAEEDQEYLERRGGILVGPKRHNDHQDALGNWSKKPKILLESQTSSQSDSSQLSIDSYDSMDDLSHFRDPIKYHAHPIHNEHNINLDPLTNVTLTTGLDHFSNTLDDNNSSVDPLFMSPDNVIINYNSYETDLCNEGNSINITQDPLMQVLQEDGAEESEQLVKKQLLLKTKMDQQQGQLNEIQTGLDSLSSNADTRFLKSNYSNLKAVHEEQAKQFLRTVQKHQNIGV
ncbi:Nuclear translocator,Myc-type, basic helix-loop-helix (bHLH) domain,PAS fold,PAS domain [Cinara cedri]|uniref:Nuclear translocator,Myc-type, basic helix-loop-helix (BHLH) domain,PAS fold,PAS domain n=1 Tax=Cinara cedri TaxID=506608 RepID=A0A5E4N8Y8_9HEMI|nr:Nuclear translocator,Myc-type, basic helix-loop-helix (bHLH) domain,PAS fold,PAS domain [Cinara cedri]